jgi:hypothetical protein
MPTPWIPPAPSLLAAVEAQAARQGGVFTWEQARAAGLSDAQARTLVRRGAWRSLGHGLLTGLPSGEDHTVDAAAGLLRWDRRMVISHASAGVLWQLPYVDRPPVPTFTAERARRGESGVYVAAFTAADVTHWSGLPITTPERTLVDLLRTASSRGRAQALADGAARRAFDDGRLDAALRAGTGWPGIRQAREAWQHRDGRIESVLESCCRVWFRDGGLPEPEPQIEVRAGGRILARVDFLFREQRTAVESDGRLKYDDPAALWQEKLREDRLRDLGFEVVRATWADGADGGAQLVERVRRAFTRADRRTAA